MKTICGFDCSSCPSVSACAGCTATNGKPFGGSCVVASCARERNGDCASCNGSCTMRQKLIDEINALSVPGMPHITKLAELPGGYINLTYPLPNGKTVQFWDESRVYLGTQVEGAGNGRCFGVVADEHSILVCTYGENGTDPEILIYCKRQNTK